MDTGLSAYVVRFAPLHADGTIGAWGVAGIPPGPSASSFAIAAYWGYIYQVGGAPLFLLFMLGIGTVSWVEWLSCTMASAH